MTINSRRRKKSSLATLQFEHRMAEMAFLSDDIASARDECVESLDELAMSALDEAYRALDGLPLWQKHTFWTNAAAAVAGVQIGGDDD